ncbi:hypothetical protein [Succinatimonas hippei]|uniref:hypothetical protein n=1 Tax=Succinatimonas hippei TaxID=626938 RepID=UPI00248FF200|nr:hypothetical protein [Succinatimonas hippei]
MKHYSLIEDKLSFCDALKMIAEEEPKTLVMFCPNEETCFYIDEDECLTLYDFDTQLPIELGNDLTTAMILSRTWEVYRLIIDQTKTVSLEI